MQPKSKGGDDSKGLFKGSPQISSYRCLNHALTLLRDGSRLEAEEVLRVALSRNSTDENLLYNYAVLLGERGKFEMASQIYRECINSSPNHVDALWNGGELFRLNFNFDIAYQYLSRFEKNADYRQGLYHRLAVCLWHLGRLTDAEVYFEKALNFDPHPLTEWEFSLFLLSIKDYKRGFSYYRNRFLVGEQINVLLPGFGLPRWDGDYEKLANKTLFILPEQGLGDQIQFLSCVQEFVLRVGDKARVVLIVRDSLYALIKTSFSDFPIEIYPHEINRDHLGICSQYENAIEFPLGDLPWAIGLSSPHKAAYLRAPEKSIAQAKSWLEFDQKKINIGISWVTSDHFQSKSKSARNIPISAFLKILNLPKNILEKVNFISLAVGDRAGEVSQLYQMDVRSYSHLIDDFSDTAGLIECCDYVIAPCTSLAHVAGAMGKKVLLLLQKHGDWRWGNCETHSDWYPNVTIFQQKNSGDWYEVLDRLSEFLLMELNAHA